MIKVVGLPLTSFTLCDAYRSFASAHTVTWRHNQPTNQPTNQSVNQLINQSINQSNQNF